MADAVAKTSTPDAAAGNPIDVTTVTTGAGVVDRQVVALGDPAANNKVAVTATGEAKVLSTVQPGIDIGDVTINNAAGAAAVNIQDGGNSITVDGTVTTSPPANASENVAQFGGTNVSTGVGAGGAGIPRVTLSNDSVVAEIRAATLHVTGTAAVNTALTITLPAAGVGLFHYITSIQWHKLYSVLGVANGAGVLITSTNLPGNPAWTTEQAAGAVGTVVKVIDYQPTTPLKSSVANTATTIVAPLQLQTIWRGNVSYFIGA